MEVHYYIRDDEGLVSILEAMNEGIKNGDDDFELAKKRRGLIGFRGNQLHPSTISVIQNKLLHFLQQNASRFKTLYIPGTEN